MAGFFVPLIDETGDTVAKLRIRVRVRNEDPDRYVMHRVKRRVNEWCVRMGIPRNVFVGHPQRVADEVKNAAVEGGDQRAEWLGRRATTIGGGGDGPRF